MKEIDPVILGHNQFIGVNHSSQDAARIRAERFSDINNVASIVESASDFGVTGIMLSTHTNASKILQHLKSIGLASKLNIYPLIPYAQGYVRKMNTEGISGLVKHVFDNASFSRISNISFQGGMGFLKKDFEKLLSAFIDLELSTFTGFNVKAIFLHEALVDLCVALQAKEQIYFFIEHISEKYDAIPAFATMNFARFMECFTQWGISKPLVMTSFNRVGFQMNPSKEVCEQCLWENDVDIVAMSTLAAGYLNPNEAYEYLFSLPNIASVVVGVSTVEHAQETFKLINQYQRSAADIAV